MESKMTIKEMQKHLDEVKEQIKVHDENIKRIMLEMTHLNAARERLRLELENIRKDKAEKAEAKTSGTRWTFSRREC